MNRTRTTGPGVIKFTGPSRPGPIYRKAPQSRRYHRNSPTTQGDIQDLPGPPPLLVSDVGRRKEQAERWVVTPSASVPTALDSSLFTKVNQVRTDPRGEKADTVSDGGFWCRYSVSLQSGIIAQRERLGGIRGRSSCVARVPGTSVQTVKISPCIACSEAQLLPGPAATAPAAPLKAALQGEVLNGYAYTGIPYPRLPVWESLRWVPAPRCTWPAQVHRRACQRQPYRKQAFELKKD
ncbi:hypothetical protein NDU88_000781 [Pleurodeles waltl]|uniref:Uncharacterized protein n=1 Tax=Pleurodeles waltl TaxID=8319 RepID=A0AAV7S9M4_PLEWA|nr:hypothetical protein NDU88_000781 [Pleurodeles waltl]